MASFLGGLGNALLGGMMGTGGGGMLGSLFGGGSGGMGNTGGMGGSSSGGGLGDAFGGILRTLAPIAGTALGTYFGGPAGGMIGGNLAGALSNSLFGGGEQQQQQQGYGPQQSYGNQFGTSFGNNLNQGFNKYIPSQMQGQTLGNVGGALGSYFGNKFGMPELGSALGNIANPYLQRYIPQNMRDVQMGNIGGYLGNQFGEQIDRGFQNRGLNPYQTPNYGSPSATEYSNPYGNIPPAPPLDLYNEAPGGFSSPSSYGNIPPAPPLGDIYSGAPGGYYGSRSNVNAYPMQEPSADRAALLNDIRNFRRTPASQPESYGNIPAAPPLGDVFGNSPRSSSGFGMRSGVSRPISLMSEFRERAGQPGMGLRPAQTRASGAYPSSGNENMMDLLRNRLGDIRGAVAPNEYPRNYTVMGA